MFGITFNMFDPENLEEANAVFLSNLDVELLSNLENEDGSPKYWEVKRSPSKKLLDDFEEMMEAY